MPVLTATGLLVSTALLSHTALASPFSDDAIVPPLANFGVATHFYSDRWDVNVLIPAMKKIGMSTARNDFYWRDFEKEKGKLEMPPNYRKFVDALDKADIGIIPILDYGNSLYATPDDPQGIMNLEAYTRYVRFVMRSLKGKKVVAWEIWNEPNNFGFRNQYKGDENGKDDALWLRKFAELVEATAKVIREEDPNTPIITGASRAAPSLYMMQRFPESFKNVDGLVDHPYPHRLPPETSDWGGPDILARDGIASADDDHSITSMFRHLREGSKASLGRELPLWLTELGFPTFRNRRSNQIFVGLTEEAQAAYLARMLIITQAQRVRMWNVYTLIDEGDDPNNYPKEEHAHFGILRSQKLGYSPKPAYFALHRIAQLLGNTSQPLDTPPAKLQALPRFVPFNNEIWSRPPIEQFPLVSGPQIDWFKTPQGMVAFVWEAGRYNTETTSVLGKISFEGQPKFASITAWDLQNGEEVPLKIDATLPNLVVDDVPVDSFPTAILFRN